VYVCSNYPQCDAYVGANETTAEPLGTLANAALRKLRVRAHAALDPLWIGRGPKARVETYIAVAEVLGIKSFHIGTSTVEQCEELIVRVDEVQACLHAKTEPRQCRRGQSLLATTAAAVLAFFSRSTKSI
jgi:hypothetical protein